MCVCGRYQVQGGAPGGSSTSHNGQACSGNAKRRWRTCAHPGRALLNEYAAVHSRPTASGCARHRAPKSIRGVVHGGRHVCGNTVEAHTVLGDTSRFHTSTAPPCRLLCIGTAPPRCGTARHCSAHPPCKPCCAQQHTMHVVPANVRTAVQQLRGAPLAASVKRVVALQVQAWLSHAMGRFEGCRFPSL